MMDYFCYEEVDQSLQQANANIIMDWLTAPADGPKLCELTSDRFDDYVPIIATIREV